jgi:hypothetical protein
MTDFHALSARLILADLSHDADSYKHAVSEASCCVTCFSALLRATVDWAAALAVARWDGHLSPTCTEARRGIEAALLRRVDATS